jgi:hypothetical protein
MMLWVLLLSHVLALDWSRHVFMCAAIQPAVSATLWYIPGWWSTAQPNPALVIPASIHLPSCCTISGPPESPCNNSEHSANYLLHTPKKLLLAANSHPLYLALCGRESMSLGINFSSTCQ